MFRYTNVPSLAGEVGCEGEKDGHGHGQPLSDAAQQANRTHRKESAAIVCL